MDVFVVNKIISLATSWHMFMLLEMPSIRCWERPKMKPCAWRWHCARIFSVFEMVSYGNRRSLLYVLLRIFWTSRLKTNCSALTRAANILLQKRRIPNSHCYDGNHQRIYCFLWLPFMTLLIAFHLHACQRKRNSLLLSTTVESSLYGGKLS